MRTWLVATLLFSCLACRGDDSAGGDDGGSTTDPGGDDDGNGADDVGSDDEDGDESDGGQEDPCAPLDATLADCSNPRWAVTWDGSECVALSGCECEGEDCDDLFLVIDEGVFGDPTRGARHACWTKYIELSCMTDPCDCGEGQACVANYDGTCLGGEPLCVDLPAGCSGDLRSCDGGCPQLLCGEWASQCDAPPCEDQWPPTIGCYGI